MKLIVYWTRFAENKLEDIYNYSEETAGPNITDKIVHRIIDRTIGLEKTPHLGPVEKLLTKHKQGFRSVLTKNYKIIYWINLDEERIEVVNVFDTRRNPKNILDLY